MLAPSLPEVAIITGSTPPCPEPRWGPTYSVLRGHWASPHPWWRSLAAWACPGWGYFLTRIRPPMDNQGHSVNLNISCQPYWLLKIDYFKWERSWAEGHSDIRPPLNIKYFINCHSNFHHHPPKKLQINLSIKTMLEARPGSMYSFLWKINELWLIHKCSRNNQAVTFCLKHGLFSSHSRKPFITPRGGSGAQRFSVMRGPFISQ